MPLMSNIFGSVFIVKKNQFPIFSKLSPSGVHLSVKRQYILLVITKTFVQFFPFFLKAAPEPSCFDHWKLCSFIFFSTQNHLPQIINGVGRTIYQIKIF